jgi:hypothetical protein
MRVKLEEEVIVEKPMAVRVRPTLYADKCDSCGKVFAMKGFSGNDGPLARLDGTFEQCPPHKGNMFSAIACSFACAHEIFASGGWRRMEQYKEYADADIRLVRVEIKLTAYIEDEQAIRSSWEKVDQTPHSLIVSPVSYRTEG